MTRLDPCKQEATESVRDYVDAMRLLFAKTRYPAEGQATKFTSGLNGKFRNRVQNNMPRNMDHAVEIALYFKDLDIGSSSEKAIATAEGGTTDSKMAKLTDKFDKLALSLTEAVRYGKRDNSGGRGHQPGGSQQQYGLCFNCNQFLLLAGCSHHQERPDCRAACCRISTHARRQRQNCKTHFASASLQTGHNSCRKPRR